MYNLQPLPERLEGAGGAGRPVGEGGVEGAGQLLPDGVALRRGVGVLAEVLHRLHHALHALQQVQLLLQREVGRPVGHGREEHGGAHEQRRRRPVLDDTGLADSRVVDHLGLGRGRMLAARGRGTGGGGERWGMSLSHG